MHLSRVQGAAVQHLSSYIFEFLGWSFSTLHQIPENICTVPQYILYCSFTTYLRYYLLFLCNCPNLQLSTQNTTHDWKTSSYKKIIQFDQQIFTRFSFFIVSEARTSQALTSIIILTDVKVKLSLCFNSAPCHEGKLEEWRYISMHSWPQQ
jgi:hypothetical protein